MLSPVFQMFRSTSEFKYYFRFRAPGRQIILSGENFPSKESCVEAIGIVKLNSAVDTKYEIFGDSFNLLGNNNEPIAKSVKFASPAELQSAIDNLKVYAPKAEVEDNS